MSKAANCKPEYIPDINQFYYSKSGTNSFSIKDPEIRPRSIKKDYVVAKSSKFREDIKQKWSGVVIAVDDEELTVRLEDLTNFDNPNEIVVLSRDEIDNNDQNLIQPGALFYWYIGYRQGIKYSKERISIIRFRRLPQWTKREIEEADKLAEDYAEFFLAN